MPRSSTVKVALLVQLAISAIMPKPSSSQAVYARLDVDDIDRVYPADYDFHNCSCSNAISVTRPAVSAQKCLSDNDCAAPAHCAMGECTMCKKVTMSCFSEDVNRPFKCCPGNACQKLQNSNSYMCLRNGNNCVSDLQCPQPYRCVSRAGKCGMCLKDGERCNIVSTVGTENECCTGFCDISMEGGNDTRGICKRPVLGECRSNSDCTHNFECHNRKCVMCFRSQARCNRNDECCTGNCVYRSYNYKTCA